VAKVGAGFSIDPAAAGAPLTWIKLGHATSAEIEALANTLKPTDIMDVSTTDPLDATYTKIFVDGKANWVRVKPGMEKAAAFLETHRYANLMGASMAFTKLEGTTVNAKDKIAYSALQNIQASMVRGNAAWRESLNVTVEAALVAGGVMAHTLTGGQRLTPTPRPSTANGCRCAPRRCWSAKTSPPTRWATPPTPTRSATPTT
jgi:hypothetical protein